MTVYDFGLSVVRSSTVEQMFSWMTANLLTHNTSQTEFLLIGLKNQLVKIHNSLLNTSHSARNLGFIFDEHFTFSDQITALSKACYYHIRQLRCIWPYFDSSTTSNIATSIIHSKLDYCNSLNCRLPKSQLSRLQQIQNSLAYTVIKASKSRHITPIQCFLHWLRITEHIEYKLPTKLSQLPNRHTFITSSLFNSLTVLSLHLLLLLLGLQHHFFLKITDRCFRYASPGLSKLEASLLFSFLMLSFLLIYFLTGLPPDLTIYFFQNRPISFPGQRSYEATKPGFRFLCKYYIIVYFVMDACLLLLGLCFVFWY